MTGFLARIRNISIDATIATRAQELGRRYGASAADALHIALAEAGSAGQFVTTENRTKPMYRVQEFAIAHLDDL